MKPGLIILSVQSITGTPCSVAMEPSICEIMPFSTRMSLLNACTWSFWSCMSTVPPFSKCDVAVGDESVIPIASVALRKRSVSTSILSFLQVGMIENFGVYSLVVDIDLPIHL